MNNTRRLALFVFLGLVGVFASFTDVNAGWRCRRAAPCPCEIVNVEEDTVHPEGARIRPLVTTPTLQGYLYDSNASDGALLKSSTISVTISIKDTAGVNMGSYTTNSGHYQFSPTQAPTVGDNFMDVTFTRSDDMTHPLKVRVEYANMNFSPALPPK